MATVGHDDPNALFAGENFTRDKIEEMAKKENIVLKEAKSKEVAEQSQRVKKAKEALDETSCQSKASFARRAEEQRKRAEQVEHDMEEVEKRRLIHKIKMYIHHFPGCVERISLPGPKSSLAEVYECYSQIKEERNASSSVQNIANYFGYGFTALETIVGDGNRLTSLPPGLRPNLKGIGTLFRTGKFPELNDIMLELDIEYPWLGSSSLMMRTIHALTQVIVKVHMANTNPIAARMFNMMEQPAADISDLEKQLDENTDVTETKK
jgi:hypothetical protein